LQLLPRSVVRLPFLTWFPVLNLRSFTSVARSGLFFSCLFGMVSFRCDPPCSHRRSCQYSSFVFRWPCAPPHFFLECFFSFLKVLSPCVSGSPVLFLFFTDLYLFHHGPHSAHGVRVPIFPHFAHTRVILECPHPPLSFHLLRLLPYPVIYLCRSCLKHPDFPTYRLYPSAIAHFFLVCPSSRLS